jgi:hypothetical protein
MGYTYLYTPIPSIPRLIIDIITVKRVFSIFFKKKSKQEPTTFTMVDPRKVPRSVIFACAKGVLGEHYTMG